MTVAELIVELLKQPQAANAQTEGCDCNADAASVRVLEDGSVMICRPDSYYKDKP